MLLDAVIIVESMNVSDFPTVALNKSFSVGLHRDLHPDRVSSLTTENIVKDQVHKSRFIKKLVCWCWRFASSITHSTVQFENIK